jgi:hypothetical protein
MPINIKDASNATVPVMSATLGSDQVQQIGWAMQTRSDTYTGTGNGTAVNVATLGMSKFALQVKQTGTVTSWQVDLEASLDGTNFVQIASHTKAGDGDGAVVFTGANQFPALYFRTRCVGLTLGGGTNVVATIVGMP